MKKILLSLALVLAVTAAGAQDKKVVAAQKAVAKAQAATENPKNNVKAATWVKLAQAYLKAYDAPTGDYMVGTSITEMKMIAQQNGTKLEEPSATSMVTIGGNEYQKLTYQNFDCYTTADGRIVLLMVTNPAVENPLGNAIKAVESANACADAAKKEKDIKAVITRVATLYGEAGNNCFGLGDVKGASEAFENAYTAALTAPNGVIDTTSLYNSALTAYMTEDFARAEVNYGKCLEYGYCGDSGEVYVKLADIARRNEQAEKSKDLLEEAFVKYPESNAVLLELISYYSTSGENTDRLFVLLDNAKSNDKSGTFLYYYEYVEGNIRLQLGQIDEAIAAYDRSAAQNPEYEYAYIGKAQVYAKIADDIMEASYEVRDWKKYDAMMDERTEAMKKCVTEYEKSYNITKNEEVKASLANVLKQICFQLRNVSAEYNAMYEKYNAIVNG